MRFFTGTNFLSRRPPKRDDYRGAKTRMPTKAVLSWQKMRPAKTLVVLTALTLASHGVIAHAKAGSAAKSAQRTGNRKIAIAGVTHGPLIIDMEDGKEYIDKMVKAAHALNEYRFNSEMTVYKDGKTVVETSDFYFKRPRLIRVEITSGPKKGAVAVLRADGKVRAHLGGALKFFVVTLDSHSEQLNSANEYPMVDSDFTSLAEFLANWSNQGIKSRASKQPIRHDGLDKLVTVVEMYKDNDAGRVLKRIFVDSDSYLPVEWYDYRDGALWSRSVFTNLVINPGLKDSLFDIK